MDVATHPSPATREMAQRALAPVDRAVTRAQRRKGLLGEEDYDRVILLRPARQVHTFGMRFAIDVAWCDRSGLVLRAASMPPNRLSTWVARADFVLEARRGTWARLGVDVGDRVCCRGIATQAGTWLVKC